MPQKIKPTPDLYCRQCGKKMERQRYGGALEDMTSFSKRKFCDRGCMAKWMYGRIKNPNPDNSHRQSARMVGKKCEACGRMGTRLHVHHIDRNPMNNDPQNLRTLCASCHRRCHSPNYEATGEQRKPCEFCNKPSVKRGWCNTHNARYGRFGHPLAKKRKIGSDWVLMLHDGSSWSPFRSFREPKQEWLASEAMGTQSPPPWPPSSSKPT